MFIAEETARAIVSEMKSVTGRDINLMDDSGTILASTLPPDASTAQLLQDQDDYAILSVTAADGRQIYTGISKQYFQQIRRDRLMHACSCPVKPLYHASHRSVSSDSPLLSYHLPAK